MFARCTTKNAKLFGYTTATNQTENDADSAELFKTAARDHAKKLVVFGGLHGYDPSGAPTGQSVTEKGVCSFSMGDRKSKGVGTGVNFIYENIAKFTTAGSDVTAEKQQEIATKVKRYLDSGNYYVLVSWCFSRVWLMSSGL